MAMKMAAEESRFNIFRQPHFWTLVVASFFFILFIVYGHRGVAPVNKTEMVERSSSITPPAVVIPNSNHREAALHTVSEGKVGRQDTFYDILVSRGVTPREVSEVVAAAKPVFDLSKIRVGNSYRLGFDASGNLALLEYEIDDRRLVRVDRNGASFSASMEEIDYEIRESAVSAEVNSSLYDSLVSQGESPLLAIKLAEIFAWDLDFNTDLRKGDRFSLVMERKYRKGEYVRDGRILAAEFVNRGRVFRAIYFKGATGRGDYYTDDGRSLRKQFLKAPLRYSYISSGYSRKRLHPILKKYRPHQGVDYAAPRGTPVVAIGDGKVIWAGKKGWNGIFVKLKHNGTYTSSYGHLSRLGKGIKKGVRVEQGQVIGYVGSTGMATGPHVDFRIRKYDKYVNPLKLEMPPAKNVPKEEFVAFATLRDRMLARLMQPKVSLTASSEERADN
jgi:murein DD-endopeptidase MepM/ murein hydrolase activator NlpD